VSNDLATGYIVFDRGRATFQPDATAGNTDVPGLGRWFGPLNGLVAPDGRSYVKQEWSGRTTTVHIVDATSDRVVLRTNAFVRVIGWSAQGILMADEAVPAFETLKLEVLDPATGAVRPFPLPPPQFGMTHEGGSYGQWGFWRTSKDIWMVAYSPSANSATFRRYDLATGVTTVWFDGRTDGRGHLQVVGADPRGQPIVQLSDRDLLHSDPARRGGIGERTLVLTAPHEATVINQGRVGDPGVAGNLSPLSVVDGDRVWLAADDGTIWLYEAGAGLRATAQVTVSTQGAPGMAISGPCR
jgi:hypothetical protein